MKILITGALGQDGTVLTKNLEHKHELYGICRTMTPDNLKYNHMNKFQIKLFNIDLNDTKALEILLKKIQPEIIVNFAGETDIINPWHNIEQTFRQNFNIPVNLMQLIKTINKEIFLFQASSSLMFANSEEQKICESSKFKPKYPYGISKLATHNMISEYRNDFGLQACSGIFFNHESYYRPDRFLTKKLSNHVIRIMNGDRVEKLKLSNLNYYRDISHADDFMKATRMIIENKINDDFIFSSNKSTNLFDYANKFYTLYDLEFGEYVDYIENVNNSENYNITGDNTKLKKLGWQGSTNIEEVIRRIVSEQS